MSRILITGASRGIGRACLERLHRNGATVIGGRSGNRDESPYFAENGKGGAVGGASVSFVAGDLREPSTILAYVDAAGPRGLTGIVLNAGVAHDAPFDALAIEQVAPGTATRSSTRIDDDPLDLHIDLDLLAPLKLLRALLRADALAKPCSVVLISSNVVRQALVGKLAYTVAKAGIESATRGLARELGPREIRVNAVAPGLIRTDMTSNRSGSFLEQYAAGVPLGRVGEPEDIAAVVAFLLSEDARYVTGQIVDVDGGAAL